MADIHPPALHAEYYVPPRTHWPILGAVGLACFMFGFASLLHDHPFGPYLSVFGALCIIYMIFGWFGDVIQESRQGLYSAQMDRSFRWGMIWFIFSEVMFFAAFFGTLLYARHFSVPWLGGMGDRGSSHLLWPSFSAAWPVLQNPDPSLFKNPKEAMGPWGLPAINTLILLTSGATVTWAHWALIKSRRTQLAIGLLLTIILGASFLALQAFEYHEAYEHMHLTLSSGIYGTTFFMLTGFHGLHVTLGTVMLLVIFIRCLKGHFNREHHFGFEAVAWYWHFVDVVWLFLFVLVYWL